MEIAGAAVGVIGLFSACVDVLEKIDSYRDFDVDFHSVGAKFEADRVLFRRWGRAVGIDKGRLSDAHHEGLDEAETASAVAKILSSIQELHSNMKNAQSSSQSKKGDPNTRLTAGQPPGSLAQYQNDWEPVSRKQKLVWSLRNKARYISKVDHFGALVQRLQALVPADGMKGIGNIKDPFMDGGLNGTCSDYAFVNISNTAVDLPTWYLNTERIFIEAERKMRRKITDSLASTYADYSRRNAARIDCLAECLLDKRSLHQFCAEEA